MVLETTCCCFGETSEVPVSKELLLSEPPEQLPIGWPRGGGWVGSRLGPTQWVALGQARSYPVKIRSCLVSSALGEFKTRRRNWKGQQPTDMGSPPQDNSETCWCLEANLTKSEDQMPNRVSRGQSRPGHQEQTRTGSSLPLLFLSDFSHPLKAQFLPEHACAPST